MKLKGFKDIVDKYQINNFSCTCEELYSFMKEQSCFSKIIREFKDENSPEGDFARDYIMDKNKPRNALNILQHIVELNACDNAVKAYFSLVERFMKYSKERNNG